MVRGSVDSEESYGGMIDATGPINEDATLMYRLVGSFKHRENDQDYYFSEPKSGMAALTFRPDHRFESTLTYERMDKESIPEMENNFLIEDGPLAGQYYPVPREFFWGSPNDRVKRKSDIVLWDGTWSETEKLKISGGLSYHNYKQSRLITRAYRPSEGPDANGMVKRYAGGRLFKGESFSASLDVSGVVRAGAWRHDWLTGVGYGTSEDQSTRGQLSRQSISDGSGPYPVDPIDINNPVYTDYPFADRIWAEAYTRKTERSDRNLYLQDMIHLPNGRTRLMLSGGWSQFRTDSEKARAITLQKWSPRLAVMHDLNDTATVYASYGESFTPQRSATYLTTDGKYITDPVEGVQYEVGYKQDLFDADALFTAAVFSLDRKNVASVIENLECTPGGPAEPSLTPMDACYELSGLTRAQGIELSLSGQILTNWMAHMGYAFTDTKYVDTDNEFAQGRSVEYTPHHSLSIWNKFRLHRSAQLGEFNLGLGLKAWSKTHDSWTDTGTDWNLGYGLVDLGMFWNKDVAVNKELKVSLNISNLFDKHYYDRRRFPPNNVLYGDERRAALSVQLSL